MTRFARAAREGGIEGEVLLAASPGKRLFIPGSLPLMQCLFYCCRRDALVVEVNEQMGPFADVWLRRLAKYAVQFLLAYQAGFSSHPGSVRVAKDKLVRVAR